MRADVVDLTGPEFDCSHVEPATKTLAICAGPRTGSTEFGRFLMAAGLGIPHEYFHPDFSAVLASRWGLPSNALHPSHIGAYIEQLRCRRSSGGVFATKLQYWQYADSLCNEHGRALFKDAVVVHLFRADVVGQLASLHRAQETGRYDFTKRIIKPPKTREQLLNKKRLLSLINFIAVEDAGFRRLFMFLGIRPIFSEFGRLTCDAQSKIREIGQALAVPLNKEGLDAALAATAPYPHSDNTQHREQLISRIMGELAFVRSQKVVEMWLDR